MYVYCCLIHACISTTCRNEFIEISEIQYAFKQKIQSIASIHLR